jgi:hypothetical protein
VCANQVDQPIGKEEKRPLFAHYAINDISLLIVCCDKIIAAILYQSSLILLPYSGRVFLRKMFFTGKFLRLLTIVL